MIVRKVAFEKTIGMPNYSNDRPIVVEADLEPGETKEQAWTRINQDMIAWHQKEYPHLYQEPAKDMVPYEVLYGLKDGSIPTISRDTERLEIQIDNAKTMSELKSIKEANPVMPFPVMKLYNDKMEELSK